MTRLRSASLRYASVCCGLLSAALGPRADASLVIALDTNELAKRSDHIAVVDVVSVQSAWDTAHKKIITTVDLAVVESWKGGALPASHFTVLQPGGTVGDVAMVVFGLSSFTPGERTLVFLRGKTGTVGVVGMAQGKRSMRRDAASGQWMIDRADHAGLGRVAATPGAAAAAEDGPRSLDEMRGQVRQILKATP